MNIFRGISAYIRGISVLLCIIMGMFLIYYVQQFNHDEISYDTHIAEHPLISPPFLQAYDSLSTSSIKDFMKDWREWSEERKTSANDTLVNRISKEVLSYYKDREVPDSSMFTTLADRITVIRTAAKFRQSCRFLSLFRIDEPEIVIDTSYVVPAPVDSKPVLYVTSEIEKKLDQYLHWVYKYLDEGFYEEVHPDREAEIRQYCPICPAGDIPGYYTYYSFPRITKISIYQDGISVDVELTSLTGERLFLPDGNINEAIVYSFWE